MNDTLNNSSSTTTVYLRPIPPSSCALSALHSPAGPPPIMDEIRRSLGKLRHLKQNNGNKTYGVPLENGFPWAKQDTNDKIWGQLFQKLDKDNPSSNPVPSWMKDGVPWSTPGNTNILWRLHIQDQVLWYLKDRKFAQTQHIDNNPAGMQCILPKETVPYTSAGKQHLLPSPFYLPQITDNDNPARQQFALPTTMDNTKARTFTAVDYAVRELGRPLGKYIYITPYDTHSSLHLAKPHFVNPTTKVVGKPHPDLWN